MRRTLFVAAVVAGLMSPAMTAVATAAPAPTPTQPAGSIGIRLLDAPIAQRDDPRARLYVVDQLTPGATTTRHLRVSNTSSAAVSVKLYASAASDTKDVFSWAPGHKDNELTSWTSVAAGTLEIAAGGTADDTVTINVPKKVSSGTRYGVIWAELGNKANSGVTIVNRVGIRMYLTVKSGTQAPPSFNIVSLTGVRLANGQPAVTATVRNTGGNALDFAGSLALSNGPGGIKAGPYPVRSQKTIAPGATGTVTTPLNQALANGPWTVNLSLSSNYLVREKSARLTFLPAPGAIAAAATKGKSASSSVMLWSISGAIAVLLIAAGLTLGWRYRRHTTEGETA